MQMCECGGIINGQITTSDAQWPRCQCPQPQPMEARAPAITMQEHRTENRRGALNEHRRVLLSYLRVKTDAEDWHGVSDAANDLREIDAELKGMRHL